MAQDTLPPFAPPITWPATAPSTGTEMLWGVDAQGNRAAFPLSDVQLANISNLNPRLFPNWRRALSRVKNGRGRAKLNLLGHSALMGQGAGTADSQGALTAGAQLYSVGRLLAASLRTRGVPARQASIFGTALAQGATGFSLADLAAYDPRLTLTGTWNADGGGGSNLGCVGGWMLRSTASGSVYSFKPPVESWDRVDVFDAVYNGGGGLTADTGTPSTPGTTLATISTSQTSTAMGVTTVSAAADAVQAINLRATSATGTYMVGVETYRSTVPEVSVRQLALSGTQSARVANVDFGYSFSGCAPQMGGDLTIVECMRNDVNATSGSAAGAAAFQANLLAIVTKWQTVGDVMLLVDHEPNTASFVTGDPAFKAAIRSVAATKQCAVLDIPARQGGGAASVAAGIEATDNVHLNADGWQDIANMIAAAILFQN